MKKTSASKNAREQISRVASAKKTARKTVVAAGVARPPKGSDATRARSATAKPQPARARVRRATPEIVAREIAMLRAEYPDARCSLDHRSPFELLVATILSAQSTDVGVNLATPALFAAYPTPEALADARQEDVEKLIHRTGFFRSKAKSIIAMARALVERHGGRVPNTMEELTQLAGVGRKTANVVLGNAFGMNEGVVVDTHVARVSARLGWTKHTDPVKIEQDLIRVVPRDEWTLVSHLLIFHGRAICHARIPKCADCILSPLCPSSLV